MLKKIIFLNLLCIFLIITFTELLADNKASKKNLTFATAQIEILPMLQLSENFKTPDTDIIFIHPPKVGGTNITYLAFAEYGHKTHRFVLPKNLDHSPHLITEGWTGGMEILKEYCSQNKAECSKYKFITGHFPYGVHSYLPGHYKYMTLIRNPIEREISAVNFDYQRGYIKNYKEAHIMLYDIMIDNPQVRLLAGEQYMKGKCDEHVLAIAKENLAKDFILVGVTDDAKTFIQAFITIAGDLPVAIGKSQVTKDKIIKTLSKSDKEFLINKHKYDLELYHHAKALWVKWKQDNILGYTAISNKQEILTIMPDMISSGKVLKMTKSQINSYNAKHSADKLVQIKKQKAK